MKTNTLILSFAVAATMLGCSKQPVRVTGSTTEALSIDARYEPGDSAMTAFIAPYKEQMEVEMSQVIGYAGNYFYKARPESPLTNWASDVLLRAGEVFQGLQMDIAVCNIGGLRCDIPEGEITVGTIFKLMPFDNTLAVVNLTGEQLYELFNDIAAQGGQGIAGARFTIRNGKAENITVQGKAIEPERVYRVATSNYLAEGNDHLYTLAKGEVDDSGWTLRDVYLGIVQKDSLITAENDGRIAIAE